MEQKTERFIKKVENAFVSGTVSISQFENLTNEWKQLIYIQCYQDDDAKQVLRRLNHLKLTVQWYLKQFNSQQNKTLSDFFEIMIQYIDVELQSLRLKTIVEKRTSDIKGTSNNTMSWTATKRDLIELISALHSAKCINSGNIKLQRLVELFESIFEINLEYYHPELNRMAVRTSIENRGLRAYFLSDLVDSFNAKIQNLK